MKLTLTRTMLLLVLCIQTDFLQSTAACNNEDLEQFLYPTTPMQPVAISRQDSSEASSDVQYHQIQDPDDESVVEPLPSETSTVPTNEISRQDYPEASSNIQDHPSQAPDYGSGFQPLLSETTPEPMNDISRQASPEARSNRQDHPSQDPVYDSGMGQHNTTPMPPTESVHQDSLTAGSDKQGVQNQHSDYPDERDDSTDKDSIDKSHKSLGERVKQIQPTVSTSTTEAPVQARLGNNSNAYHPGNSSADNTTGKNGLRNAVFKLIAAIIICWLV